MIEEVARRFDRSAAASRSWKHCRKRCSSKSAKSIAAQIAMRYLAPVALVNKSTRNSACG